MKEKISVKTLYLLGIITIGLIGLGLGSTYAMFTASAEIDNPISINANLNSEDDIIETIELELEPNDIRVAVINLNNTSNTTLNYASFYITKSNDIEVGVTHNFTDTAVPTGSIENGTTKKVYIQIKNNGSSTTNVTLGVLSNSGNIVKSESMTLINDTNIDTTSPEILITGQDMVVQDGLIRYYNASNNLEYSHSPNTTVWKDLSGNYDGEVNNLTWNTGSAVFNGTSSNVRIGQINNLTAVTVEVYLKANSYTTDSANQIISNYNGNGLVLQLNKGVPGFSIGSGKTIASDETIDLGINHTITGTYDGSTVKLYVDGVLKKTLSSIAGISNPTDLTPMVIGCNPNETGCDTHYTAADIYAARIYNRALTQNEINKNMNADRISVGGQQNTTAGDFTILSNKRLNGFTEDNISIPSRFRINNFTKVNDKHYILSIEDRELTAYSFDISIPANNAIDVSGNKNSNAITYTYEHKGSSSNLVGSTITKNTSTSRTVTYTITFNDNVYGFTKDDITISEGTKGTFTKIDQKTYTLVVTHASDGSKTITVKANSCNDRFGNLNAAKSLTHTITTDTTKPTITNIAAKAAVNSNTITATLKDNKSLTGYAITTSSTNSCSGTAPTSWTSISGTTYNLSKKVTTYGNHYIWTKDASGNTNCTSKPIYKITYTTSETTTCKINSASLAESSKTLVLNLKATCACAARGTCKNNSDYGTDTERANLRMYIYGNSNSTYTITSKTTDKSFQDVHYQKSDGVHTILPSNRTTTSYGNGLIRVFVGYGRTATVNDVSVIITKIVVGSTTIYNGGFVNY